MLSAAAAADGNVVTIDGGVPHANREVEDLLGRSRRLLDSMHSEDREEAIDLHERIEAAIESRDDGALRQAGDALKELLFFVEGFTDIRFLVGLSEICELTACVPATRARSRGRSRSSRTAIRRRTS